MSMSQIATSLGSNPLVERGPLGDIQRLRCPAAAWEALLPGARLRIYDLVLECAIEAWPEADVVVFHRASYPLLTDKARADHAQRVAFLLADEAR